MKKFVVSMIAVLALVFTSIILAQPVISTYHYQDSNNNIPGKWISDNTNWPSNKKIALLIHGFPVLNSSESRNSMLNLALHLSQARKNLPAYDEIYAVEYDHGFLIIDTAAALRDIVNNRCQKFPKDQKIDIFAHSMGGLVARCAIENNMPGGKTIDSRVARLVTMSTPHNGFPEIESFELILGDFPDINDMSSKGLFISGLLNPAEPKRSKVSCDYYSIVGLQSDRPVVFLSEYLNKLAKPLKKLCDRLADTHDGLVDIKSSGFDLTKYCHQFKKRGVNLNHLYVNTHQDSFDLIDAWMTEDNWFGQTETVYQDDQPQTNNEQGSISTEKPEKTEPVVQPKLKKKGLLDGFIEQVKEKIKLPSGISEAFGIGKAKAKDTGSTTQTQTQEKTKPAPIEKVMSKFKTGIPILIGCNFDEIVKAIGKLPDETQYGSNLGWTYRIYPFLDHGLCIRFNDDMKNRQVVCAIWYTQTMNEYGYQVYNTSRVPAPVSPAKIIPKEIWSQEPMGIYRGSDKAIVIQWQFEGNTYLATLEDTKRLLVKPITGINQYGNVETTYAPTEHTKNFRACDKVLYFGYVNGYPELYKSGWIGASPFGSLNCNYTGIGYYKF